MKLDSSVAAIVTGGASGLGEATARMLAAKGCKVALFDMNAERGTQVAQEIGGIFAPCDVSDEASCDAALATAKAAHGIARVVVNCAGIAPARRTISKKRDTGEIVAHDLATFAKTLAVNLTGTFTITAKAAAAMATLEPVDADGQRGCIIATA
ncbi:MAG: SDR family NAD(P)-dependent oxidoreductase, partial [Beijerinckiaceae bacterium]